MKRTLSWMVVLGGVGVAVAAFAGPKQKPSEPAKTAAEAPKSAAAAPAAAPGGAAEEKIVYTFENEDKMQAFGRLWQQRQAAVVRMKVLESYWTQEQAAVKQLNEKLAADYALDVAKNYVLDPKRRVLIEREAAPASEHLP